jgi:hypothetical protein
LRDADVGSSTPAFTQWGVRCARHGRIRSPCPRTAADQIDVARREVAVVTQDVNGRRDRASTVAVKTDKRCPDTVPPRLRGRPARNRVLSSESRDNPRDRSNRRMTIAPSPQRWGPPIAVWGPICGSFSPSISHLSDLLIFLFSPLWGFQVRDTQAEVEHRQSREASRRKMAFG